MATRNQSKNKTVAISVDQETRIQGLKNSIIAVYGDALDKIGFSVTEKANRSAQTRLGKTIKTLNTMENKDETCYRKKKYELKLQLEKLQQEQLRLKRSTFKRSKSLDDIDDIPSDERESEMTKTEKVETVAPQPADEKVACSDSVESKHTQSNAANEEMKREQPSPPVLTENANETLTEKRSYFQRGFTDPAISQTKLDEAMEILRSAPKSAGPKHVILPNKDEETESRKQDIKTRDNDVRENRRYRTVLPNLNKAHFLVQTGGSSDIDTLKQENTLAQLTEVQEENALYTSTTSLTSLRPRNAVITKPEITASTDNLIASPRQSPTHNAISTPNVLDVYPEEQEMYDTVSVYTRQPTHGKRSNVGSRRRFRHTYYDREWIPPTREDLLDILAQQKRVLQKRIEAFLLKENPGEDTTVYNGRRYHPNTFT